jgi:hypothetical protein
MMKDDADDVEALVNDLQRRRVVDSRYPFLDAALLVLRAKLPLEDFVQLPAEDLRRLKDEVASDSDRRIHHSPLPRANVERVVARREVVVNPLQVTKEY